MARTDFRVRYDGPALRSGTMEVRDLAPSLLALADLFASAGRVLYPENEPLSLSIRATEEGSFVVDVMLQATGLWDHVASLLTNDNSTALANLLALVAGAHSGLVWLTRKVGKRAVRGHQPLPRPGWVLITLDDGTRFEAPTQALRLFESTRTRRALEKFVEPLAQDGIDEITFQTDPPTPTVTIGSADLPALHARTSDSVLLSDETAPLVVTIAAPELLGGTKWRFTDGSQPFSATVKDNAFLARVRERSEAFLSGDMLRCQVRTIQRRRDHLLNTEREIIEVLEHIPGEPQIQLGDEAAA